jgi:uncharacterized protein YecT (DUF1311 family)
VQRRIVAVLFGVVFWVASSIGAVEADPEFDQCVGRGPDNLTLGRCSGEMVARAESRLNEVWDRLMAKVSGRTKDTLIVEQGSWIEFKERACNFYASGDWGREGTVYHAPHCKARVIEERTKLLEEVASSVRQ